MRMVVPQSPLSRKRRLMSRIRERSNLGRLEKEHHHHHPNKERRIIFFSLIFYLPLSICCSVTASKKEGRETGDERRTSPLLLWLIFSTIFCSGSPHCTWERWRAWQPLREWHFISKTGLQSTCCYCWGCKSRGLRAKMDFHHNSSTGWPLLAFFAHRTKSADVVSFEWQHWFVSITQRKPNKKKNKVDLTTNNIFVQSGFISWQEAKSSAPEGGIYCTVNFLRRRRGRGGKNKNVRCGQIKPVLLSPMHEKACLSYKLNKHQMSVRAAILSNGFHVTAHLMACTQDSDWNCSPCQDRGHVSDAQITFIIYVVVNYCHTFDW